MACPSPAAGGAAVEPGPTGHDLPTPSTGLGLAVLLNRIGPFWTLRIRGALRGFFDVALHA